MQLAPQSPPHAGLPDPSRRPRPWTRRAALERLGAGAALVVAGCTPRRDAPAGQQPAYDLNRRVSLEVWAFFDPNTPPNDERVTGVTAEFAKSHPQWQLTWAQGPGRCGVGREQHPPAARRVLQAQQLGRARLLAALLAPEPLQG